MTAAHVVDIAPQEGIFLAMQALVRPGDRVVACAPAYQSLHELVKTAGGTLDPWFVKGPSSPDDESPLRFDVDELERIFETGKPPAGLVVNFPHNPTGALPTEAEWARIVEMARSAGAWLFSDEMYRGLEHGDRPPLPSGVEVYEKAIVLAGMSKVYSLPGLRLGWLVSPQLDLILKCTALKDYTTICSAAPSQLLALMGLKKRDALLARSKALVADGLERSRAFFAARKDLLAWHEPQAGSIGFPRLRRLPNANAARRYCEALAESDASVLLLPASVYEAQRGPHVRLGFGRNDIETGLAQWGLAMDAGTHAPVPPPVTFDVRQCDDPAAFDAAVTSAAEDADAACAPLYVLFTASVDATGKPWCPDCVAGVPVVEDALKALPGGAVLLKCTVQFAAFRSGEQPYRTDSRVRLPCVPFLGLWRDGRVSGAAGAPLDDAGCQDAATVAPYAAAGAAASSQWRTCPDPTRFESLVAAAAADAAAAGAPLVVLFVGADRSPGVSWCADSAKAAPAVEAALARYSACSTVLLTCPVEHAEYLACGPGKHRYATDPRIGLSRLPALGVWSSGRVQWAKEPLSDEGVVRGILVAAAAAAHAEA